MALDFTKQKRIGNDKTIEGEEGKKQRQLIFRMRKTKNEINLKKDKDESNI